MRTFMAVFIIILSFFKVLYDIHWLLNYLPANDVTTNVTLKTMCTDEHPQVCLEFCSALDGQRMYPFNFI